MNYLIDTQILIWYQLKSDKLSLSIYELINDARNVIFVSTITLF
jgi:PIN domain nuclease of toxin-antitoxin system